jgi:predicted nucleotidyltransferase
MGRGAPLPRWSITLDAGLSSLMRANFTRMDSVQARDLLTMVRGMVQARDDLRALAVCGSWARGSPRADSDLDLLILAREPTEWRTHLDWLRDLPFEQAGFRIRAVETATYGEVWSAHICLGPI